MPFKIRRFCRCCFFFVTAVAGNSSFAQSYILRQYAIFKESAVAGTAINYCGRTDTIKIDIYKPIGDNNPKRPVAIFAHGGSFTSTEDAADVEMSLFAAEFARRGYAAVSIDYREGYHLFPFTPGLPVPANMDDATKDLYNSYDGGVFAADSAEFIRAAFRAQQDMKGIIRFLKSRCLQDSTSNCKYFIGGFSAGAILSLATAFTDLDAEKQPATRQLPDAINPGWQSNTGQIPGPGNKDDVDYLSHNPPPFNYDAASCYLRPDLGSINGTMNITSGYDAKVLGVMSLAGAIMDTTLFDRFASRPAVFLYHVPGDDLVPFDTGRPLQRFADIFSPSPSSYAPIVYGSNWIWNKLNRLNYPSLKKKLFYTDSLPLSISPHNIFPGVIAMSDSVARFFDEVLQANSNCKPEFTDVYTFKGNGNWNAAANWFNNRLPVSPVLAGVHIIINPQPGGNCILNVPVTINRNAAITVVPGAVFDVAGNLTVQ